MSDLEQKSNEEALLTLERVERVGGSHLLSIKRWLLAVTAASALPVWGAELPDAGRGRLLYENHCVVCHTSKVHRRAAPLPMNLKDLRGIVAGWAREQKLNWSEGEISDVVEYLDRTYYRMLGR